MKNLRNTYFLQSGENSLVLGERTAIMGVINCTPDSFSDGGSYRTSDEAIDRALGMAEDGAAIIDVGGESTRPGADPVPVEEELKRVIPVIEGIRRQSGVWISVDTYKAETARHAVAAGAHIINDISGLRFDPEMIPAASESGVPVVAMHIQGTPRNMQQNPVYSSVVSDIKKFFAERIESMSAGGIDRTNIILDPGIGFGKTLAHNLMLLNDLAEFSDLGRPLLVGVSRKSFIGKILDLPVDQRLEGTAAAVAVSILNGAHIVRVHDVREMYRVARIIDSVITVNEAVG